MLNLYLELSILDVLMDILRSLNSKNIICFFFQQSRMVEERHEKIQKGFYLPTQVFTRIPK